jgi:hypothetical protein
LTGKNEKWREKTLKIGHLFQDSSFATVSDYDLRILLAVSDFHLFGQEGYF